MRQRQPSLALPILIVFALSACGSSQPSNEPSAPPAGEQGQPSAPAPQAQTSASEQDRHFHAKLELVGQPSVSSDRNNVEVTVRVTNDGSGAFGSTSEPHNVNLGAHAVDADGKVMVNDLSRALLPQIAAGASDDATILLPIDKLGGYRAEILPVEEGVGWFSDWGTKPLVVGPFKACSGAGAGALCNPSGKPLSTVSVNG